MKNVLSPPAPVGVLVLPSPGTPPPPSEPLLACSAWVFCCVAWVFDCVAAPSDSADPLPPPPKSPPNSPPPEPPPPNSFDKAPSALIPAIAAGRKDRFGLGLTGLSAGRTEPCVSVVMPPLVKTVPGVEDAAVPPRRLNSPAEAASPPIASNGPSSPSRPPPEEPLSAPAGAAPAPPLEAGAGADCLAWVLSRTAWVLSCVACVFCWVAGSGGVAGFP